MTLNKFFDTPEVPLRSIRHENAEGFRVRKNFQFSKDSPQNFPRKQVMTLRQLFDLQSPLMVLKMLND